MKSDEDLLRIALHGDEAEWTDLYKLCSCRGIAKRLAQTLERNASQENDAASAWGLVLEDQHPGLKVCLPRSVAAPLQTGRRRGMNILCAEDHPQIRELLRRKISECGYHVQCVCDGEAAWERIVADPRAFDVIVTDHEMPRLDGLRLVEKIRQTRFTGYIVVESASLTPEVESAYRALRVDCILRKTSQSDFLRDLIKKLEQFTLSPVN